MSQLERKTSRFAAFTIEAYEQAKSELASRIAARFTRGNVRSQKDGYLTQNEFENRLNRMAAQLKKEAALSQLKKH